MSTKQSSNTAPKYHHWLICALVVFQIKDPKPGEDAGAAMQVNAVLHTKEKNITAADMGRAQAVVMHNFTDKVQDERMKIMDIVWQNLSHMGYMSQAEYLGAKEGQALVEREVPRTSSGESLEKTPARVLSVIEGGKPVPTSDGVAPGED
ncbi:hypothetical protein KMC60_gp68 [Achromobacter phage vB_AxyP_19-32_Axy11]|uniref:Uncharacterized protein n=3 Tax=Pourcelvirus TaxID=2842976 RepID=A0A514CW05_9CAUD|nr:hypothetical protein KMC59_gp70 [Achromobacter phage vB_AxyP_19-32_Axy10]YP_010079418.1 hypothetical protein KMC60_gp68 [Achromobacter phage vB_AxyP_19-32_Axy11]QDH83954.1 hypothetical protein Axy10_048 [Achromobacter phage vB_AxyP_19-32_Axy10]QDH84036.1 hypothetical protein Axy11_047 [Achromobacter phage vB_AxyP_19-32_Axy11]QDH84632.1 hypothetical protein Axy22_045 [Achromobacter phage vB_AxyP_19-32_Axy22]